MRPRWLATLAAFSFLLPALAPGADAQGLRPYRVAVGASALASGNQDSMQVGSGLAVGITRRLGDSSFSLGLDTGLVSSTDLAALFNFVVLFPFSMWMDLRFQSMTLVPMLATVMVRKDSGWWHPYAGVSAGPAFVAVKAFDTRHSRTEEGNIIYFMALLRGGMDFDIVGPVGINLEPLRLGIFHDQFAWNPQANLVVSFLNDSDFLTAFENAAIPAAAWTHEAHVRMAFLYLRRHPFDRALVLAREGIQKLNAAIGVHQRGYHETITVAFLRLVHSRIPGAGDWEGFRRAHADLFDSRVLDRYYSKERLNDPLAREKALAPDREPLPLSFPPLPNS